MLLKNGFTFLLSLITMSAFAQVVDLEEKAPATQNGFEYGYIIKNEQVKSAGGEEYSRYELSFYISNKSGCNKLYEDRSAFSFDATNLLATFQCRNANGKRLTSKSAQIRARDFYINVKRKITDKATDKEKEITEVVKAGFIFRNGETLTSNVIVLVPKGEKPQIQCLVGNPKEMD